MDRTNSDRAQGRSLVCGLLYVLYENINMQPVLELLPLRYLLER